MSSKRSAKRSPVSRSSQENKPDPQRYLQPDFIRELRKKAVGYYIGADQYSSPTDGKRFPKEISEDPLFQAIAYVRNRGRAELRLMDAFAPAEDQEFKRFSIRDFFDENVLTPKGLIDIRDEVLGPADSEHTERLANACDEAARAIRRGDISQLNNIAKLYEIFERKTYGWPGKQPAGRKRDIVPWEYYAAGAALAFLKKRVPPTRAQVIEDANGARAIAENKEQLLELVKAWKPNEMTTDPDPAPDQEPENYYGGEQHEAHEVPVKCDLSDEDRERIKAEHAERILARQEQGQNARSQREQQHDEGVNSSDLPVISEVAKPALAQEREKLIAEKVEELRRRQPNWRRIFKDLDLDLLL